MRSGWFSTRSARFTYAQWEQIREHQQAFSGIFAWSATKFNLATGGEARYAEGLFVSGDFFRVLGVRPLLGRTLVADDDRLGCGSPAAVISYAFWQRELAGNPVGRSFRTQGPAGKPDPIYEVVGVVRNTKYYELREDFLRVAFFPMAQDDDPGTGVSFVLRGAISSGEMMRGVKSTVAQVHPGIGIGFHRLADQIQGALLRDRLMAMLAGAFGLLARMLATLGLYGVIAYMVARRRNEIGVRVALGADRGRVVRPVLREAALLLAVGLGIGTGLALWAGRAGGALLFGLKAYDPPTLAVANLLLASVALLASYLPALRASRLEPMSALREE